MVASCSASARSVSQNQRAKPPRSSRRRSVSISSTPGRSVGNVFMSADLIPLFPLRGAAVPQLVELNLVAQRVHALPETMMLPVQQHAVAGDVFQRGTFKYSAFAVLQIVEDACTAHHETAIDPTQVAGRLFAEVVDVAFFVGVDHAETRFRLDCSHGHQ